MSLPLRVPGSSGPSGRPASTDAQPCGWQRILRPARAVEGVCPLGGFGLGALPAEARMRNEPARGHEPGQGAVLSALRSVPPSSSLSSGLSLVRGALCLQETSRLRGVRPVCPFWPPHAVGSGLCSAHRHGPMDCLSHRPPPLCVRAELCRLGLARGGLVAGGNEAPDGLPL